MAKSLTSANAIIMLSVAGLFDIPTQLQGFAAEDIFDVEALDAAETMMGVDGKLSAGWIPNPVRMGVTLQADSDSIDFFEGWYGAQQATREIYFASGTVLLRSVEREYIMVRGVLKNFPPLPTAKKVLQPRKFMLEWEAVTQGVV